MKNNTIKIRSTKSASKLVLFCGLVVVISVSCETKQDTQALLAAEKKGCNDFSELVGDWDIVDSTLPNHVKRPDFEKNGSIKKINSRIEITEAYGGNFSVKVNEGFLGEWEKNEWIGNCDQGKPILESSVAINESDLCGHTVIIRKKKPDHPDYKRSIKIAFKNTHGGEKGCPKHKKKGIHLNGDGDMHGGSAHGGEK